MRLMTGYVYWIWEGLDTTLLKGVVRVLDIIWPFMGNIACMIRYPFCLPQLCFGNYIVVLSVLQLPFHYTICSVSLLPFQRFKYFSSIHLNGGYTTAAQEKPT